MPEVLAESRAGSGERIEAGRMPPWEVGELPRPPAFGFRHLTAFIGPGLMMAGANIGGGEWLFGPAVTAQYGAMLMWIAAMSILLQVFYNLEVMRYTLYCGEPIVTGFFRTVPGPMFWTCCYLLLDFGAIWPYLASNAAVPLAAAFLGHLPTAENDLLVKALGYIIFLSAFIPLIFGGKIYNALEKVMIVKIILVLGYLTFIAVFIARPSTVAEVFSGFFRFGTIPLRAEAIILPDRFTIQEVEDGELYVLKGTYDVKGDEWIVSLEVGQGAELRKYDVEPPPSPGSQLLTITPVVGNNLAPAEAMAIVGDMWREVVEVADRGGFRVRQIEADSVIVVNGLLEQGEWLIDEVAVSADGTVQTYAGIEQVPERYQPRVAALVDNRGVEPVGLVSYVSETGELPNLNWAVLAGFAAIAGAGGLTNAQFSNYARDKGWGMGPLVGAIPSAVGGKTIELSHVGKAFQVTPASLSRWRGWFRHILRDQLLVWMVGCFLGMALPAILSLEFIRNAPVEGNRVAAMTAEGLAQRAGSIFWPLTLLCGFLVLAPSQVTTMDGIFRRWTDVIWTASGRLRHLEGNKVKFVYYTIMIVYAVWGLIALGLTPNPLVLAIASTVFMNLALGFSAFHTLYVNRTLLPRELRPNWLMQLGLVGCGLFFLGICAIALHQQILPALAAYWAKN